MSKDKLWNLRAAKAAHRKWVGKALLLVDGYPMEKDQVPVNETECIFGKWYFSDGQTLNRHQEFREIGSLHEELHAIYTEIYVLLFGVQKRSFFHRLIGKKAKPSEISFEKARGKYVRLNNVSHRLVKKIEELEVLIEDGVDPTKSVE